MWHSTMASTMDKELEHVIIAAIITEKSPKLVPRDFIDSDGYEDFLVSLAKDDLEFFLTIMHLI